MRFKASTFLAFVFLGWSGGSFASTNHVRFTNSLGMVFVSVPHTESLFSIWETRVSDYDAFLNDGNAWERASLNRPRFPQGPDHPVVNVRWEDTRAFCRWLTETERRAGTIGAKDAYRLPTDLEWSAAVGLLGETGETAEKRSGSGSRYPWGTQKPFKNCGNYNRLVGVEEFEFTAPVGTFLPNEFGIFDLGGNVWEWCLDTADDGRRHILRGASWNTGAPVRRRGEEFFPRLASAVRDFTLPDGEIGDHGFRCVLDRSNEQLQHEEIFRSHNFRNQRSSAIPNLAVLPSRLKIGQQLSGP